MTQRKKLPYNPQAEKAAIGGMLMGGGYAEKWVDWLEVADFDHAPCRDTFGAIRSLVRSGRPVDLVLVNEELKDQRKLAGVGQDNVHAFMNACESIVRTDHYANIVLRNGIERCKAAIAMQLGQSLISWEDALQAKASLDARLEAYERWRSGHVEQTTLPATTTDVDPFPVEVLPTALRQLVQEGARAIGCPPDFIAVPALVLAGVAIGNSRCLEVKLGWREFGRFWAAVVALAGDKKSPALELAMEPFGRRQEELGNEYRRQVEAYKSQKAKPSDPTAAGPEPVFRQVVTTDATSEALADVIEANPRGVLFYRDELVGWAAGMNQYKNGRGADRQNWLSLWNGARVTINRRARRQPVVLQAPFVGVVGALPPDVLGDLSDERGREDGFVHRILFSYPDHMPRTWTEDVVSHDTLAVYGAMFERLWELAPTQDEHGNVRPRVVRFTEGGKQEWVEWITEHYREQEAPSFPDNLRGPWQKMEGYAARLALVLHLCRVASGEAQSDDVDEYSMACASELVSYFKSHTRRVYARLHSTPEDLQVVAAVKWIGKQSGGKITARDVQRAGIKGVKTADDAKALLQELSRRGYGSVTIASAKRGEIVTFTRTPDPTPDIKASGQNPPAAKVS